MWALWHYNQNLYVLTNMYASTFGEDMYQQAEQVKKNKA